MGTATPPERLTETPPGNAKGGGINYRYRGAFNWHIAKEVVPITDTAQRTSETRSRWIRHTHLDGAVINTHVLGMRNAGGKASATSGIGLCLPKLRHLLVHSLRRIRVNSVSSTHQHLLTLEA